VYINTLYGKKNLEVIPSLIRDILVEVFDILSQKLSSFLFKLYP